MNVIVVMLDSFRQDHVGAYHGGKEAFPGIEPCRTPNLDRFAEEATVFENMYPEGLPTIPVRTALMTGNYTLPYRPWEPLSARDVTMADILRANGYVCGLISDCYHYRAPGMNFHRSFHSYRWIRGQEWDAYFSSAPRRDVNDYVNDNFPARWRRRIEQFLANTDDFRSPEDWFAAEVFREAGKWLELNRGHENVFLWVDSFDPHEPWDPPGKFDRYGPEGYRGRRIIMPMGGAYEDWATEDEARRIRALYAGEAESVDHWFGEFYSVMERLGYLDDSAVIVVCDHGHPLGDHGKFLKGPDRMYSELLDIVFMLRLPGGEKGGKRTGALVQFQDVLPTVLDLLEMRAETDSMHGKSFRAVLDGEAEDCREAVIMGFHRGYERCIRDGVWSYVERPPGEPDELFNLVEDPKETKNLIDEERDEAERLARSFGSYFRRGRSARVKGVQETYEMGSASVE